MQNMERNRTNANSARPFVGELRHAFDRCPELFALQGHRIRLIFWQHAFVVWKIAGEFAAQQQAVTQLEEQVILIARKLHDGSGI